MQLQEIIEQNKSTTNENEVGFFDMKSFKNQYIFLDEPIMGHAIPIYSREVIVNTSQILKLAQKDMLLKCNH